MAGGQRRDPAPDDSPRPRRAADHGGWPLPGGLQAFHYSSEYATHADDVGAPVAPGERPGRTAWRVSFGRFALTEQDAPVKTWISNDSLTVELGTLTHRAVRGELRGGHGRAAAGELPDRARAARRAALPGLITPAPDQAGAGSYR